MASHQNFIPKRHYASAKYMAKRSFIVMLVPEAVLMCKKYEADTKEAEQETQAKPLVLHSFAASSRAKRFSN